MITQLLQFLRIAEKLRISIQHTRHIFPDRHRLRIQHKGQNSRCIIGAFTSKSSSKILTRTANKSLRDHQWITLIKHRQHHLLRTRRALLPVHFSLAISVISQQTIADIQPFIRHAQLIQVCTQDIGRNQFTRRHNLIIHKIILPRIFLQHPLHFHENIIHLRIYLTVMILEKTVHDFCMIIPHLLQQCRRFTCFMAICTHHFLQRIGCFTHRRDHHRHLLTRKEFQDRRHIFHCISILHRSTAKLKYFHYLLLFNHLLSAFHCAEV